MDMQQFIQNSIAAKRQETLAKSDQLTLGELILKLEPILEKQKDRKEEAVVKYDFGYLFPTELDSWRGSYSELALNYEGFDNVPKSPLKVSDFLTILKNAIGATFHGYKGGDFVMSKHTPIWIANWGNSGNTALIDVVDNDYEVILITALREF